MTNRRYIDQLKEVIQHKHGSACEHIESVPVLDLESGGAPTIDTIEVFQLVDHPSAKRCYAWGKAFSTGPYFAVLELPPVIGPSTAMKVARQDIEWRNG